MYNIRDLSLLIGGDSPLDLSKLNIASLDQALDFARCYGFDLESEKDLTKVWFYYDQAVEIITNELLYEGQKFPDNFKKDQIKSPANLLIYSGTSGGNNTLRIWSCALLKVMHMLVHLDNDLFTAFQDDIQYQILQPIKDHIITDSSGDMVLGDEDYSIPLKHFAIKPFKQTHSGVIKLLAKKETVAMTLLDRVGLRFVVEDLYSVYQVLFYLLKKNVINFAHIVNYETKNNLFPLTEFIDFVENKMVLKSDEAFQKSSFEQFLNEFESTVKESKATLNNYSAKDFKFIKFINRQFLKVNLTEGKKLTFFYPFEIQIFDAESYENLSTGPTSHEAYKERQKRAAHLRIFGKSLLEKE